MAVSGLYTRYHPAYGRVDKSGSVLIILGTVIGIAEAVWPSFLDGEVFIVNNLLVFGGGGVLGVALWRINSVPQPAEILLITAFVASLLSMGVLLSLDSANLLIQLFAALVVTVLFGLAWIVLGYHLWIQQTETPLAEADS